MPQKENVVPIGLLDAFAKRLLLAKAGIKRSCNSMKLLESRLRGMTKMTVILFVARLS